MVVNCRSINLFLINGRTTGPIKYTIANWTGLAYKLPIDDIESCKDRSDLREKNGVYLLFSKHTSGLKQLVYISTTYNGDTGQGIYSKVYEHNRDIDLEETGISWEEAIVFTNCSTTFGVKDIEYLKNRLYNIACGNSRYIVELSKPNTDVFVTEERASELEDYLEYAKLILGIAGYSYFDKENLSLESSISDIGATKELTKDIGDETADRRKELPLFSKNSRVLNNNYLKDSAYIGVQWDFHRTGSEVDKGEEDTQDIQDTQVVFHCKSRGIDAHGVLDKDGFIILSGSRLALIPTASCPSSSLKLRSKYRNYVKDGITQSNLKFNSPSGAACFAILRASNGNIEWRTADGVTLGAYLESVCNT